MNIKNNIKIALASAVLAFGTTSCNDWLNVEMEDAIMENVLFNDDEGYLSALTGCYIRMNENYDNVLTRGAIDVMAQYYHMSPLTEHGMYKYQHFDYDQMDSENDALWTNQYSNIANLNVLLEHVNNDGVLSEKYYNYVKGEALALRAFLHFDLMRIYGPIYGPDTENKTTITYQESSSKEIQPLLPAKEVMSKIIRDLEEAAKLLETDRVREDSPHGESVSDEKPTLRYRQFRLNYFATKLLLARVYMWVGDKAKAKAVAEEVIKENNVTRKDEDDKDYTFSAFPWVKKSDVEDAADGNPDRLFTSEVMFAVYDSKRSNFYDSRFAASLNMNSALFMSNWTETESGYWGSTYDYNKMKIFMEDVNDLRRRQWVLSKINGGQEDQEWMGYYLTKFMSPELSTSGTALTDNSKLGQYMLPLIRLSEAYLILAECEAEEGNLSAALDYINQVRLHRNTPNLELTADETKETIKGHITKEFMREVVGEGQLFFYYKRNAMKQILSDAPCTTTSYYGTVTEKNYNDMDLGNYTWPMPKCEMDKRVEKK